MMYFSENIAAEEDRVFILKDGRSVELEVEDDACDD